MGRLEIRVKEIKFGISRKKNFNFFSSPSLGRSTLDAMK